MSEKKPFFLENIWNEVLISSQIQRELKPRDYIYASEIGKNYWERYQKMNAVPCTDIIEDRVLRKFAAGYIFEELVGRFLSQMGLLKSSQEKVEIPECDEHLRVSGRLDYVAGVDDWDEAMRKSEEQFGEADPDELNISQKIGKNILEQLRKDCPEGFANTPLEIKSINSNVFWSKKEYLDEAYPWHVFQLYTYLKAKNLPEGSIIYISKDDMTIKEMRVRLDDSKIALAWTEDLIKMSEFHRKNQEPERPLNLVFDYRKKIKFQKNKVGHVIIGKYEPNWEIKWSSYLKLLTGFNNTDDWENSLKPEMKKLNDEIKAKFIKDNNL